MPELQQTYLYLCECVCARKSVRVVRLGSVINNKSYMSVFCDQSMDAKFFFTFFCFCFGSREEFGKTCRFFHKYKNSDQSQFVHILNKRLLDNPIKVSARPL